MMMVCIPIGSVQLMLSAIGMRCGHGSITPMRNRGAALKIDGGLSRRNTQYPNPLSSAPVGSGVFLLNQAAYGLRNVRYFAAVSDTHRPSHRGSCEESSP